MSEWGVLKGIASFVFKMLCFMRYTKNHCSVQPIKTIEISLHLENVNKLEYLEYEEHPVS